MSLSLVQSLRLAAVLEDCSDQLDILGYTLTVQVGRERGAAAAQERTRLTKLRRDCQYVKQQISKLHSELEGEQSFTSILQVVEEEEQRKKAENMQREAKMELEQRKRALRRQQEALQRKTEKLEELYWLTKELNRQLDEQSLNAAIRRSLVENDTELQLQWAQKKTGQAERLLEDQLQLLQKQLEEEARVHEESEKFLRNRQEVLQQQLQQWQQHTKQMLHEKEEQLNKVCRSRIVNLDKVTEMKRKFAEMEEVVKEEMKEQEKRDQQQARVTAATKLQAWWRGCMVRLGLGGGGDKAKEDKKSKKKKADKKKKKKK
ncbi:dynein regulatory complex protein 9 [Scophthalmus maximus]|uniref:dynein regulatory complex protein 9 n=1 Tax=Scophthalmus maximus TaxID=52904 RepID=UPI000F30AB56|nr:dynein regulatory complex protein 9 [Scophthalmus maximus]